MAFYLANRQTKAALLASFLTFGPTLPLVNPEGDASADTASGAICLAATVASIHKGASGSGLDAQTLRQVNRGNWSAVIQRLSPRSEHLTTASRDSAWLAFTYLFLNRCSDLSQLQKRLKGESVDARLIEAFDQICQDKLEEAGKILGKVTGSTKNDCLFNFASAALASKKGQSQAAVSFLTKSVEIAPDFAWGYRTLGFVQERLLKDQSNAAASYRKSLELEPHNLEVRRLLVGTLLVQNDFDQAIEIAKDGIKLAHHDGQAYYLLAQIYIQQWRLKEALTLLNKSISLSPETAQYHREEASILRLQGDLSHALVEQQKAVDLAKDKAFELVELANLNLLAGNINRAAENLTQALKLDPDNQNAHDRLVLLLTQEKRFDDLVSEYKRAAVRKPKDVFLRLGLAKALERAGKVDEAAAALKEASNLDSNDPRPHRALAEIHIKQKDYVAAIREYTKALNINPSSLEDLAALGYCYVENDDYVQAETAFVTALALDQLTQSSSRKVNRLDLMRSLAVLFLTEGRYSEAWVELNAVCGMDKAKTKLADQFLLLQSKALRDRTGSAAKDLMAAFDKLPADAKAQSRAALIDALIKINQLDLALSALDQAAKDQSGSAIESLVNRARIYRLKGDIADAESEASKAVATKEGTAEQHSQAYLELGRIQLAKGDVTSADTSVRKAIELFPKSYEAYEASGWIYLKKNDQSHAIESGKRSLELNPYFTDAYLLVGEAEEKAGNIKEASNSYKKAVELYPELLSAHKRLLESYQKLSLKDDARKEEELITQIEKRD